jgi:Fe-S cluster assembly iron-binding protein IscA
MEDANDKKTIKFDGKDVVIENKDGVFLNNKQIDFNYVMGGYILDKTLILYSVGQMGYSMVFVDSNLSIIPFEEKDAAYTDLALEDGKINAIVYRYSDAMSCKYIQGLSICNCEEIGEGEPLTKYKDILEPMKDEVVTGNVLLSYDGKKIDTKYERKETIGDLYGSDLAGTTKTYCVENHNN